MAPTFELHMKNFDTDVLKSYAYFLFQVPLFIGTGSRRCMGRYAWGKMRFSMAVLDLTYKVQIKEIETY